MMDCAGHVDILNKAVIRGWALNKSDLSERVEVSFIQLGRNVFSVVPSLQAPRLLEVLNIGTAADRVKPFVWQVPYPLAMGLRPDEPFEVIIRQSGKSLGSNFVIKTAELMHPQAEAELRQETIISVSYTLVDKMLEVSIAISCLGIPEPRAVGLLLDGEPLAVDFNSFDNLLSYIGRKSFSGKFKLSIEDFNGDEINISLPSELTSDDARMQFHESLRQISIPKSVFDKDALRFPLPPDTNMERVSGPGATELSHLANGFTTFRQLDRISKRYCGRSIYDARVIMDWGVGCGRLMRHLVEPFARGNALNDRILIGVDIDEVNIRWCKNNLAGIAQFYVIDPIGSLPAEDETVDFLYGISVMTHLTEHAQLSWLAEIKRVMKPGGCVVLTTHGEHFYYSAPGFDDAGRMISVPFVEKYGFLDVYRDPNLGLEHMEHYRSTFQSRKNVQESWSKYFEIVDIIPATNAWRQDFVVMRTA